MDRKSVLVVDDSAETREAFALLLEGEGYEVLLAAHGGEGILMAHRHRPDLILMDLSMPVVDGLDAAESLKLSPVTRGIPIVAITADSLEPQLARVRRAFDATLSKPCPPLDLLGEVERQVRLSA